MTTEYEIYDADPMQNGDCAWHHVFKAAGLADLRAQCSAQVDGYDDYPEGTTLWYIERDDAGNMVSSGTFDL